MFVCENCGIEFSAKRKARTCSPNCRKELSRKLSVTDNVTLSTPNVTDNFEFTVTYKPLNAKQTQVEIDRKKVRTAKYWYDVPLGAIPKIKKDWPKMPDYMNGRQYFLWMKNDFKTQENGTPIIHNPFPDNGKPVTYVGGPQSRSWGA